MSLERPKSPTEVALFHLEDDKLSQLYPNWHIDNPRGYNQGFNTDYSNRSFFEINTDYDAKLVYSTFGLVIDSINREINPLIGSKILEIGGSSGLLSKYLQDLGANITLLEIEEVFVNKAQQRGVTNAKIYNGTNLLSSITYGEKFKQ